MQRLFPLLILLVLLIGACSAPPVPAPVTTPNPELAPLRVAVLPIADVIPLYVAQQEDFFADAGIEVDLVPVASGAERDTLLQAGQVDCALNEILNSVLFNAGESENLRAVVTARRAFPDSAFFSLLAAPGSGVESVEDLEGATIAIAENTVIEYWTDRILARSGLPADNYNTTNVPRIPVRLELLLNGQVDAAVLPDPLATLAQLQGAPLLLDDTGNPDIGLSVISCRDRILGDRPATVRAFLSAWDQAVTAINANPQRFQNALIQNTRVPEPLQDRYTLPPYPVAELPTAEQVQDVVEWAMERGLIEKPVAYEEVVAALRAE